MLAAVRLNFGTAGEMSCSHQQADTLTETHPNNSWRYFSLWTKVADQPTHSAFSKVANTAKKSQILLKSSSVLEPTGLITEDK